MLCNDGPHRFWLLRLRDFVSRCNRRADYPMLAVLCAYLRGFAGECARECAHITSDIDQRLMFRVPDGCNLPWVQLEKALTLGLNQIGDRALGFLLVKL